MSRIIVDSIRNSSASSDALTLSSDGKVAFPNNTGNILQVVEAVKTDTTSTSTSTFNAITGLQPQITPSSTSNKVLININLKIGFSNENNDISLRLYRSIGGTETEIFAGTSVGNRRPCFFGVQDFNFEGIHGMMPVASQYLDSPNTTSQITYLVKWHIQRGSSYNYLNRSGQDDNDAYYHRTSSSITLMEVAG